MNILVVGTKPLYPVKMGNQRWISEFITQLRKLGHDVTYLYIHHTLFRNYSKEREKETLEDAAKQNIANRQIIYQQPIPEVIKISAYSLLNRKLRKGFGGIDDMYPYGVTKIARQIIQEFNIEACVVNYYYLSKLLTKVNVPIKAIVTHDSFIYRNKRTGDNTHSLTPNQEAKALQRASHVLSLQLEESALFKALAPESYVATLFMPIEFHPSLVTGNHNILYLAGSSEYNKNGILWFIDNVLPDITKAFPDAKLLIGGGICNVLKEFEGHPSVELFGFVDKVEDFFKNGDISINPVCQGSGLKIKTIESIAYDKVTIVNPHSAAGLLRTDRLPFLESTSPNEWFETIVKLWNDSSLLKEFKGRNRIYCEAINGHIEKELNNIFEIYPINDKD